jgi:hypothetical protein
MLDGTFVVRNRVGNATLTQGEVAHLVQQGDVNILTGQLALFDRSDVQGDRAIDLSQLLELSRLLPVLRGVRHEVENDSE